MGKAEVVFRTRPVAGSMSVIGIVANNGIASELAAKQREAVFERIDGADYALDLPNQKVPEGLEAVFGRVDNWFLGDAAR